jgi:hypothetical protein
MAGVRRNSRKPLVDLEKTASPALSGSNILEPDDREDRSAMFHSLLSYKLMEEKFAE